MLVLVLLLVLVLVLVLLHMRWRASVGLQPGWHCCGVPASTMTAGDCPRCCRRNCSCCWQTVCWCQQCARQWGERWHQQQQLQLQHWQNKPEQGSLLRSEDWHHHHHHHRHHHHHCRCRSHHHLHLHSL